MPSSTRDRVLPFIAFWAALLGASLIWSASKHPVVREFILSGHGLGRSLDPIETTTSRVSILGVASGFLVLAAGALIARVLVRPGTRERATRGYFARVGIATVVAGLVAVPWVAFTAPEPHGVRLGSVERIEAALAASGLECRRIVPVEPSDTPGFSAAEERCLLPWKAAVVRGGLATVVLDVWESSGARDEWIASPSQVGEAAVAGPGSLVRCEFRAICAIFQARTDGQLILPPAGETYDLSAWRYNVKPFSIEVEHGITGHEP